MTASHTVIWKSPSAAPGNPLVGWQVYDWLAHKQVFEPRGFPGPLNGLARSALDGAIEKGRNVSIAQQAEDPAADPAALLSALMRLRPATLICPERGAGALSARRWVIADLMGHAQQQSPQPIAEASIQAAVNQLATQWYPLFNQVPTFYVVPTLILRHDHTAQELGLVEPEKITPDMILGMVAEDEDVRRATANFDRATPRTSRELVRARDEAMAKAGIPPAQRAYLYSGEVDSYLIPRAARLGPAAPILQQLRREFAVLYGDYAERTLSFALRNYHHAKAEDLRREAGITVQAEAA